MLVVLGGVTLLQNFNPTPSFGLQAGSQLQQQQQRLVASSPAAPLGLVQQHLWGQGQQLVAAQQHGIAAILHDGAYQQSNQPNQPGQEMQVSGNQPNQPPWSTALRTPSDIYTEWAGPRPNGFEPLKAKEEREGSAWRSKYKLSWAVRFNLIKSIQATAREQNISPIDAARMYDQLFSRDEQPESITSIHRKLAGRPYPFQQPRQQHVVLPSPATLVGVVRGGLEGWWAGFVFAFWKKQVLDATKEIFQERYQANKAAAAAAAAATST